METKQTAVMYLLDWLMDNPLSSPDFVKAIAKAKQMEKKQIIQARGNGIEATLKGYSISNEDYYNETYGN